MNNPNNIPEQDSGDKLDNHPESDNNLQAQESKYLSRRAKRGSREKFEAAMKQVPDVEPEEHDKR